MFDVLRLFAVLADPVDETIPDNLEREFKNRYILIRPGQWFVVGTGTAAEISNSLAIAPGCAALILAVSGYYGVAGTHIWEWIATKVGRLVNV